MRSRYLHHRLYSLSRSKGFYFHLAGIICIIWLLSRTLPKPTRYQYPCQQLSMTIALGYIAFWSALFFGLIQWMKGSTRKTSGILPIFLVICLFIAPLSFPAFSQQDDNMSNVLFSWTPVSKEPIGEPKGANPGRVVWVWDPDATERNHTGFWWEIQNNNQDVIDTMSSDGIKALAGIDDESLAWDSLFKYFNTIHGKGEIGYQPGEKIAIKINMVYCFINPYTFEEARINANPYVVKSLLHQLIDKAGVRPEDIILFDSSRNFFDWFYFRVYYKSYPDLLIPEFPNITYVDAEGGAAGREKVVPGDQRVYFADGSCEYRTLPTCVLDADYLINMPICKRHFGDRVTLAGKNLFGTWVEDVVAVHPYHTIGHSKMGNPAPQTDLLAHEELGKKTLLVVGDGLYAVRYDNAYASYFQMYPFNDDWMNSLFFSQDSVAIDSVMYDFLYADGTGPGEGAQNYLHQAASPPENVYDPEGDGTYVSESLGVHEHADLSVDVFSSDRYSGILDQGIDYIAIGHEHAEDAVSFMYPREKWLYLFGNEKMYMVKSSYAVLFGPIYIQAAVSSSSIEMVEFYIDDVLVHVDESPPYSYWWDTPSLGLHTLSLVGFDSSGRICDDVLEVYKFG